MIRAMAILTLLLWSASLQAFSFRCDKEQTRCEVQTKRLTVGDKIGIFTDGKRLVAIGEVTDIDGQKRIIKITKKWALLLKSHDLDIITDEAFQSPEESYSIVTPLPPLLGGAQLSIINLGVGDGFIATEVSGLLFKHFWRDYSYIARLHYLTGKGTASDNLGGAEQQNVSVSSFGLSGGVSEILLPYSPVSIRLDGEIGISYASVSLGGDFNEKKVLNDRITDGIGAYVRGGVNAIWRRDGLQPEIGLAIVHIHNSNNTAFMLGVNGSLR